MHVRHAHVAGNAMQALHHIFLLRFFFRTAAKYIGSTIGKHERYAVGAALEAMALDHMRLPSFRHALLVFREHGVGKSHLSEDRHRACARQRAAEILLHETQRTANARAGGMLRIGTEKTETRIKT